MLLFHGWSLPGTVHSPNQVGKVITFLRESLSNNDWLINNWNKGDSWNQGKGEVCVLAAEAQGLLIVLREDFVLEKTIYSCQCFNEYST